MIRVSIALAAVLCLGFAAAAGARPSLVQPDHDLTGVWWARAIPSRIVPANGATLPYTQAGRAMADRLQARLKIDPQSDRARHNCLPKGLPRAFLTAYPIQALSTPEQTTLFFEENRQVSVMRYIPHHHDPDVWGPFYMGDTIAHWEGDTLIADSRNFIDEVMLDASGVPHSDKFRVVQRFRKLNAGKQLEVVATVEDPEVFTRSWSTRFVYDRRDDVDVDTSWICGEPHRDVSTVKQGP